MPIYEYKCTNDKCSEDVIELKLSIKSICKVYCKGCGQLMSKLISKPSVKFNGSGFHCNDYNSKNPAA